MGQLEDCATSKQFGKRQRKTVATLEGRMKKYEPGSPPYLALEQTLNQANNRFKRYADSNLLCGKDGLPHLMGNGDPEYFPQFLLPGLGFLYTTGWIGTAGRKYLRTVAKTKNPAEKEIIIDVPLALTSCSRTSSGRSSPGTRSSPATSSRTRRRSRSRRDKR